MTGSSGPCKSPLKKGEQNGTSSGSPVTLIRLGQRSQEYFDFLAAFARRAIDDRTPFFGKVDQDGRITRGEFSSEFLNWCANNDKNPRELAAPQISDYLEDTMLLAEAEDPRAVELFRRGLDSLNPFVVQASVQGLGRQQDVAAIPLIAKACQRPPGKSILFTASGGNKSIELGWDVAALFRIVTQFSKHGGEA